MSNTMKLTFQGDSDDTFGYEWENGCGDDHDDCARGTVRVYEVKTPADGRIAVGGTYGHACTWAIGLALIEDDEGLPAWAQAATFGVATNGYSVTLTMDVPDGTTVTLIHPEPEE